MAILKIARMGNPILRTVATVVPADGIRSPEIQTLIDDMLQTVDDERGAGLAAPQVHVSKRVVVLRLDDDDDFEVWINPEITPITDAMAITFEGCLSVPGIRGAVARFEKISVCGFYRDGVRFEKTLEDFSAIVAQHECDHLDGILYIDRVDPRSLAFIDEHHRYSHLLYEDGDPQVDEARDDTDSREMEL